MARPRIYPDIIILTKEDRKLYNSYSKKKKRGVYPTDEEYEAASKYRLWLRRKSCEVRKSEDEQGIKQANGQDPLRRVPRPQGI